MLWFSFGLFSQDSSAAVTVGPDISFTGWGPWDGEEKSDLLYYYGFLKCDRAWLFSSDFLNSFASIKFVLLNWKFLFYLRIANQKGLDTRSWTLCCRNLKLLVLQQPNYIC